MAARADKIRCSGEDMATQTRGPAPERAAKPNRPAKPDRTTPAQFVREVRDELRKVVWPTRKELVTYTTVALVFILIMVGIVTSLDYGFTRLVLVLFG
jgi:preprotein translocase subunit SecE